MILKARPAWPYEKRRYVPKLIKVVDQRVGGGVLLTVDYKGGD